MPLRRFIPALTTLGVVAGLAVARMAVEALPMERTVATVAAWMHGPRPRHEAARPESGAAARPVAAPKPRLAKAPEVIEIEVVDAAVCEEPEVVPADRPSYEPPPTVTNSAMPPYLRGGA